LIRAARTAGLPIAVPAGALAQVWRDGRRQARLAGLLRVRSGAPNVVVLNARTARAAGELYGRAGTADVVDASVVLCALARRDRIVTSDPDDLRRLDPAHAGSTAATGAHRRRRRHPTQTSALLAAGPPSGRAAFSSFDTIIEPIRTTRW
jgi:hypothetical protein